MRDVSVPPEATTWEQVLTCENCRTSFTAETGDLQGDRFKKPDTYWFDGSADAAGLTYKFFVYCPACNDLIIVPDDEIPVLVQREIKQASRR